MPNASDRFEEAIFFAKRALDYPSVERCEKEVTWLVGAHLAAFIGITDAAMQDYSNTGREFRGSAFELELKLPPNGDPVSANRAYRDLRNLRAHFGVPLVVLDRRPHLADIATGEMERTRLRWYFRPMEWAFVSRLRTPQLREVDVARFNHYVARNPINDVMGQMLLVARAVLSESAQRPA